MQNSFKTEIHIYKTKAHVTIVKLDVYNYAKV